MFRHLTPLDAVEVHRTGSRKHGATQKQFQDFIRAADAGLRVEMHGQNYVAMSRNMYDELIAKANSTTVMVDEGRNLSDDAKDAIDRILATDWKAKS